MGHHQHKHLPSSLNRAFIVGIVLNVTFVAVEFVAGFWSNSMGLLSDAGHNLSDVASLALAMLAFRMAKIQSSNKFTYGYKKSTVLVSLLNAIILLIAVFLIAYESIDKILNPQPIEGKVIAWVAAIGIVINSLTAWLFIGDKEKDLNIKGAYLHMAADALVSVGVVISGVIIMFTGWNIVDPIIGLLIACIIVYSTWSLLSNSLRLALDGVPNGIDVEKATQMIREQPNIVDVHHVHIWAISTTQNAITAHIVITNISEMEGVKMQLKQKLGEMGIEHATLEFESPDSNCSKYVV